MIKLPGSARRILPVDYVDGRSVLPEEMYRIFLISNHACPKRIFDDPFMDDVAVYITWKSSILPLYPNVTIEESPAFLEMLGEKRPWPDVESGIFLPLAATVFPACFEQARAVCEGPDSARMLFRWYAENAEKLLPGVPVPGWLLEEGGVPGISLAQEYFWHTMSIEFRQAYPIHGGSPLPYLGWLRQNESKIYGMCRNPEKADEFLDGPATIDTGEGLTGLMEGVWKNSPQSFSNLPLDTVAGRIAFSSWFARNLSDVYGLTGRNMRMLASRPKNGIRPELPLVIAGMFFCDHPSEEEYNSMSKEGLRWYIGFYLHNSARNALLTDLYALMDIKPLEVGAGNQDYEKSGLDLTRQVLWEVDHGPVTNSEQAANAIKWCEENYKNTFLAKLTCLSAAKIGVISQNSAVSKIKVEDNKSEIHTTNKPAPPITLCGIPDMISGVGEDCRIVDRVLASCGLPHRILSVSDSLYAKEPPYSNFAISAPGGKISIFCLAAQDIYRLWLGYPPELWGGKHKIGLCPWELARWPKIAEFALDCLDEIWAPSTFCAEAFANCGKQVTLMPHAVIPPQPDGDLRREFNLSPKTTVFLTSFDAGSSVARKNPFGVIRAFKAAFNNGEDVFLLMKTMNAESMPGTLESLRKEIQCCPRTILINECYDAKKNARLLNTCDAFVSLHRSEGFGRLLAEAMSLGKLLITSDYGGARDFATKETACLVSGSFVHVKTGEYLLEEGQVWFDADIEHAAQWMKIFYEHPEKFDAVKIAAKNIILQNHSIERVGKIMKAALSPYM